MPGPPAEEPAAAAADTALVVPAFAAAAAAAPEAAAQTSGTAAPSFYLFVSPAMCVAYSLERNGIDSTRLDCLQGQLQPRWKPMDGTDERKLPVSAPRVLPSRCSFPVEFKLTGTPRYLSIRPMPMQHSLCTNGGTAVPTMKTAVLHGSMALASCLSVILAASINRRQKEAPTKKKQSAPCPASFPRPGRRAPWRNRQPGCNSSYSEVPTGRERRGGCIALRINTKRISGGAAAQGFGLGCVFLTTYRDLCK